MFKKCLALMMTVIMVITMMSPLSISAAAKDIVTITVVDQYGDLLPDATVSVSRVYHTVAGYRRTQTVTVTTNGDGTFTYDTSKYFSGTTQYYTVTASCTDCPTVSQQVAPDVRSALIALTSTAAPKPDEWARFDVYYIATGITPDSYTGAGDPKDYGPSGDDVPLVTINVNITKLKSAEYADCVVYEENKNGNAYHFIPAGNLDTDNDHLPEEQKRAFIKPFWAAVIECMDEESKEAFEATGLQDSYMSYVLKNQGSARNPDYHCDGILTVEPPVYMVEMYDRGVYFGGFANDKTTAQFTKVTDVLDAYKAHFDRKIEWADNNNGTYSGSYIEDGWRYDLMVSQTNYAANLYNPVAGSDEYVAYKKQTDQYYLAVFDAKEVGREKIELSVTYKDGANGKVFNAQVDAVEKKDPVTEFSGEVVRENYNHIGWMLEGGDGTVLSQEDIVERYSSVEEDLVFVAVYELKPATYAGAVEVVLNGSYENGVATGERVDITTVKGDDVSLAVSAYGTEFIPLVKEATGKYTAHLENGTYQIYYFDGESYELSSEQRLDIIDAPRTRYLFFNTVTYDANGGENGPVPATEYYQTGAAVTVSSVVPEKEGYRFLGWKDQDGTLYQSGASLTAAIGKAYVLTAQWEKILYADVDVTVILDHTADGGDNANFDKELEIDLTYRPVGSGEDYVEVVGKENFVTDKWYTDGTTVDGMTTVTYESLYAQLDMAYEYGANVFLSEYDVYERTVTSTTDGEGNVTYHVTVKMRFDPDQQVLQYGIEERIENDELVPLAVDIKVLCWYDPSDIEGAPDYTIWYPIFEHVHNSHDALFTDAVNAAGNHVGFGSYNVWMWEDKEDNLPYYYRIGTVGFTLADGTELTATTTDGIHFVSVATAKYPAGAYTAVLETVGGGVPEGSDLEGAYFDVDGNQNGTLTLVVEAHPYTVTLDPKGGVLNGSTDATVIEDQFTVPSLDGYVPTRNDAYVFDKWVLLDENGNETDKVVNAGDALTRDITLVAAWKEPLTVEGLVTVGATYEQLNSDGFYSIQPIPAQARPKTATVLLQKIEPNGYTETVRSMTVILDYTNAYYYHDVVRVVGAATYIFKNIPDDGTQYRIQMLLPNYTSFFQNEPEAASEKEKRNYPTYNDTDYTVVWDDAEPINVGTVNIHNHFDPEEFELTYTVDASAIGEGFRPEHTELLITSDALNEDGKLPGYIPSEWQVISQMIINRQLVGDNVALDADGIGHGSDKVWVSKIDGVTRYQYGLRLYKTDGEIVDVTDKSLPYTVEYEAPAHYLYGTQSDELKAILTPKTYPISYELGGGTATGDYPTAHTWSYDTALDMTDPTFAGFVFEGWYLDEDFTEEAPAVIDASVAEAVTLYAKWKQAMDVVDLTVIVHHTTEGGDSGLAGNYDKTLYAQLTSDLRSNDGQIDRVYADVEGCKKEYRNGYWHTTDNDITKDVFQVPAFYTNLSSDYDYSVNVLLDGYYVVNKTTEKTPQFDGSTLHKVVVELQFNPELLMLDFVVEVEDSVAAAQMPVSAEVKVTSWYDNPLQTVDWQWFRITQHSATTVTVEIDPTTREGHGTYPVWMWYNKEQGIPYHYRIEVLQLNFADGSASHMTETTDDVMYHGGGFHAEIKTKDGSVPHIPNISATTDLEGVYGRVSNDAYVQQGEVRAVIGRHDSVIFHANNADYAGHDAFRTYYHHHMPDLGDGTYRLHEDGTLDSFYDIPTFDYLTHNNYIFKGWYMHPVSEDEPFVWTTAFEGSGDVYAHWITVDDVAQEEADSKIVENNTYREYDLTGVQIRDEDIDEMDHYGNPASGLRFITVLSERVYEELEAVSSITTEYGFVVAATSKVMEKANGNADYTLQYADKNVNGVNTEAEYGYVKNLYCNGVDDHFNGENYRLYTAVITYNGLEGAAQQAAYATEFTARSYLRYKDANGLLRTYYNNYTGTAVAGGCSASFAQVQGMM